MNLIIVTGISGSGKTTVARALTADGHVALDSKLNPGLFHFIDASGQTPPSNHPNDPAWLIQHKWVLDRAIFDAAIAKYPNETPIFLCGGGDSIKMLLPSAKKCFLLEVDAATMLTRLNSPTRDNQFGQSPAAKERLLQRLDGYQAHQLAAGAIPIDATQPISLVIKNLLNQAGLS